MLIRLYPLEDYDIKIDGRRLPSDRHYDIEAKDGSFRFDFVSYREEANGLYWPAFSAKLDIKNDAVTAASDCFSFTDWGGGANELRVVPHALPLALREIEECALEYDSYDGERYPAYIIAGAYRTLYIEGPDTVYSAPLPEYVTETKLESRYPYIFVAGKALKKKYLSVFKVPDGYSGPGRIFEDTADEINADASGITVKLNFLDMLNRTRSERYVLEGGFYKLRERKFEYGRDFRYKDYLLPYLFLEAVGAADTECIKKYAAEDIADASDDILEYFGSFYSVEYPRFCARPQSTVALKYRNGRHTKVSYFKFQIQNSLITDFEETE